MTRWLLLFCLSAAVAGAQTQAPTPEPTPRDFWRADMPAGSYVVKLSAISTVAMQEYVVDNAARVTEVNIGTLGGEYARFYYIEPNVPQSPNGLGQSTLNELQDKAREAVARVDGEAWKRVVKNYPTTTHARTIEYRLEDKATLHKLFESIENAWVNNRGKTFKP